MAVQPYVDDQLMQPLQHGGQLTHAAICGFDGGIWAQSPDFPGISDEEVEALMAGFSDANALAAKGLYVGGEKYMVVAGEPGEVIRGKLGAGGITVKKTISALVLGIYGEGVAAGDVNVVSSERGGWLCISRGGGLGVQLGAPAATGMNPPCLLLEI